MTVMISVEGHLQKRSAVVTDDPRIILHLTLSLFPPPYFASSSEFSEYRSWDTCVDNFPPKQWRR